MARKIRKRKSEKYTYWYSTYSFDFNNTIVTITDDAGNAVAWSSAGALGFKGSKKNLLRLQHRWHQKHVQKRLWKWDD